MIVVHHLEKSRSFRILWALEELEQPYQIQYYQRTPQYSAPQVLKQIHALGKAPILTDETAVLVESGAILEYLQSVYDLVHIFKPQIKQDLQQYLFWLHYAEGSFMPLLVFNLILNLSLPRVPFLVKPIAKKYVEGLQQNAIHPRLSDHVDYVENYLSTHDYLAGDFSFADIQMSFPLTALITREAFDVPHIQRYLTRIQQRPAYQRALKKEQSLHKTD